MRSRIVLFLLPATLVCALLLGCNVLDGDYKSGIYWLEKENNPQSAARAFQRSLERNPKRWKTNQKLLEALSQMDDTAQMEKAIRDVLKFYPDSARAASVAGPGMALMGEDRYNHLVSAIELHYLGQLLATRGDNPLLLSRAIMSSCRGLDSVMAPSYYKRLVAITGDEGVPDSVIQEMNFFIGSSQVKWLRHELQVIKEPDNFEALVSLLNVGIIIGDSSQTYNKLRELVRRDPERCDKDIARRFGLIAGIDPFQSKSLVTGWDGAYSPDGKYLIYIKDRGRADYSDQYIYRASANGSGEKPIMKAAQQFLTSLALPRYSPDGKWIYFYGSPDKNWMPGKHGRFHLYRIRPTYDSRPQKLTDTDLLPVIPHFESDGSVLLVRRDVGSIRASVEVIRLNPQQRSLSHVSRIGEPVLGATFTSRGDSLIFTTDRGIFRRSVNGGKITVDLNWSGLDYLLMSPDDSQLLISTTTGKAFILDRETSEPTFIGSIGMPLGSFYRDHYLLITRVVAGQRRVTRLGLTDTKDYSDQLKRKLNE